jgi:hypothetical protein
VGGGRGPVLRVRLKDDVNFITPTIVKGHVYVGTPTGVAVFGLLISTPAAPTNLRMIR